MGIHLILATQRPSVDVITGPSRPTCLAACRSGCCPIDSRTILDQNGSEALLGKGDMLFLAPGTARLQRVHGPYLSVVETKRIVQYCARQAEARFNMEVLQDRPDKEGDGADPGFQDDRYDEALRLVVTTGQASTSNLQRKMGVGYARAGKLMDLLEANGVVGGPRQPRGP